MRKINLNLPLLSFFPKLEGLSRIKKGSRLSRFFRPFFEGKYLKKLLGTNIAFAIIATTLLPNQAGVIKVQAEENIVAESPIILPTDSGIKFPVETVVVTQGFKFFHPGLDFDGLTGDPVRPILSGNVEAVDYSKYAYGNAVYINHGNGLSSLYAHLSKILVKEGQEVKQDQVIGLIGASGNARGDHLHFETRQNGVPINPLSILPH